MAASGGAGQDGEFRLAFSLCHLAGRAPRHRTRKNGVDRIMWAKLFFAVGILIMLLTGGCSLLILSDPYLGGNGALLMVAVIGGVPFLVGLGIAALAWRSLGKTQDPGNGGTES
jgi:uncharacterized membrane protein YgdD (TMEM256/DUF423 family)